MVSAFSFFPSDSFRDDYSFPGLAPPFNLRNILWVSQTVGVRYHSQQILLATRLQVSEAQREVLESMGCRLSHSISYFLFMIWDLVFSYFPSPVRTVSYYFERYGTCNPYLGHKFRSLLTTGTYRTLLTVPDTRLGRRVRLFFSNSFNYSHYEYYSKAKVRVKLLFSILQ